jgi:hypothetical protein
MIVPEEWPPRPEMNLWALQNPAYRPADTFSTAYEFAESGANLCPAYDSLTLNTSDGDGGIPDPRPTPIPLTPIITHVIPNHPVDGVFRRGNQALKKR